MCNPQQPSLMYTQLGVQPTQQMHYDYPQPLPLFLPQPPQTMAVGNSYQLPQPAPTQLNPDLSFGTNNCNANPSMSAHAQPHQIQYAIASANTHQFGPTQTTNQTISHVNHSAPAFGAAHPAPQHYSLQQTGAHDNSHNSHQHMQANPNQSVETVDVRSVVNDALEEEYDEEDKEDVDHFKILRDGNAGEEFAKYAATTGFKESPIICLLCKVPFTSRVMETSHFEEERHFWAKEEDPLEALRIEHMSREEKNAEGRKIARDINVPGSMGNFMGRCNVCDVDFPTTAQMETHLAGKKHRNNERLVNEGKQPIKSKKKTRGYYDSYNRLDDDRKHDYEWVTRERASSRKKAMNAWMSGMNIDDAQNNVRQGFKPGQGLYRSRSDGCLPAPPATSQMRHHLPPPTQPARSNQAQQRPQRHARHHPAQMAPQRRSGRQATMRKNTRMKPRQR